MKSKILLFTLLSLFALDVFGRKIVTCSLTKRDRGLFGYKTVIFNYGPCENGTQGFWGDCYDPGYSGCRPPSGQVDEIDELANIRLIEEAENAIANKNFVGSIGKYFGREDGTLVLYTVSWNCNELGDGEIVVSKEVEE
jgi:hypothetical protein